MSVRRPVVQMSELFSGVCPRWQMGNLLKTMLFRVGLAESLGLRSVAKLYSTAWYSCMGLF